MAASTSQLPRPRVVLAIGKLDGVHAGHRHLAAHAQAVADSLGALSAAVVLHPDPATVLAGRLVPRLTTIDDRARRLHSFGVDIVEPWRFTNEVAQLKPEQFIDQLVDRFEIVAMVVGPDFAFGRDRTGDLDMLVRLGDARGFSVHVVPPLVVAGEWVSSRRIRLLIEEGNIGLARTMLRAPPRVVGTVVHGAARGRQLGFPTANLDPTANFALPANGIYTVVARWFEPTLAHDHIVRGVASVGVRPTFDNGARLLEVHLIDFDGELYGREMTVDFLERMRPELRFDSIEALVEQMVLDTKAAVAAHAVESAPGWTMSSDGMQARVLARDVAALCERTAHLCANPRNHVNDEATEDRFGLRRVLSTTGDCSESVFETWLARLREGIRVTHVYEAGDTTLHALVRSTSTTGSDPIDVTSNGPVRNREDGWLEADLVVTTAATAPKR